MKERKELRIKRARTCYDHLAGRLGVAICERLLERDWLREENDQYAITSVGETEFQSWGIDLTALRKSRRKFAYPCLGWSERKYHIGGALGAALAQRLFTAEWITASTAVGGWN